MDDIKFFNIMRTSILWYKSMGWNVSEYGWYPINFLINVIIPQKEISTVLKDHLARVAYFPSIFIMVTSDSKSILWLF